MSDDEEHDFSQLQLDRNRKHKKAGGWQALGLDHTVYKGIEKKGYRQPTPIQRKAVPCILDGKDVVAMSRTGSGKTAAFVIPLLQKLKRRETTGIRGLLISPTRELALQTFKVVKELGRFTGLRCAVLVGGDAIEDQFSSIHENPDILIATPGRLLHVVVEMDIRLSQIRYVVFDEADRLFEMGFQDQLTETLKRIPESRQTLLFSATLPKMLVDFAKAGLTDPMLVRLDVDEKISDKLSMVFGLCRADDKMAALVHLCRKMDDEKKQTVVFCATMKHVEYVVGILNRAGVDNSFIYSQLDSAARKQNISRFRDKKNNILVVTDVAARGVDIPLLDTVINVHFPPKAKLFVHRVGRVARAGRTGTAISLISADELPYLADLFLFLGKPMNFAKDGDEYDEAATLIGRVPDNLISLEADFMKSTHEINSELIDMKKTAANAHAKFTRTRPPPSAESARRVKEELRTKAAECSAHPFLRIPGDDQQYEVLNRLANWKGNTTIFELNVGSKQESANMMKAKRKQHEARIKAVEENKLKEKQKLADEQEEPTRKRKADDVDESELAEVFSEVVKPAKSARIDRAEQRKREKERHYVPYTASDHASERQLALDKVDFARQADGVAVEIFADDDKGLYKQQNQKRWDRKLKKFVSQSNDEAKKKIRTEDGTWLPASYKTGRYEEWKKKQKISFKKNDEDDDMDEKKPAFGKKKFHYKNNKAGQVKSELKNRDQIMKERRKKIKLDSYMEHRRTENLKRKSSQLKKKRGRK